MFPTVIGAVLDLDAASLTTALAFLKTGRMSVDKESNETLFPYGLNRVLIQDVPEAIIKYLMDYPAILPSTTIENHRPFSAY